MTTATTPERMRLITEAARRQFDLKLDLELLDDDQTMRLAELSQRASGENTLDLSRFSALAKRDRARFEKLIETAAGSPGHFAKAHENADLQRNLNAMAARVRRRPPQRKPRFEPEGTLVVPLFHAMIGAGLPAMAVTVLVFALDAIQNGPIHPHMHVETDGTLVIDQHHGLLDAHDPEGRVGGSAKMLKLLHQAELLSVETRGGETRIRIGAKLQPVFDLRAQS